MTGLAAVLVLLFSLSQGSEGRERGATEGGSWRWQDKSTAVGVGANGCWHYEICAVAPDTLPPPARFYLEESMLDALAPAPAVRS